MGADATINQGDDVVLAVVVYSDSAETTAKNLTGYTVLAYRIGELDQAITKLELTEVANGNGSVVAFGTRASGEVNVTLAAGDTATLAARAWDHQLILTDASSNDRVVVRGQLTIQDTLPSA